VWGPEQLEAHEYTSHDAERRQLKAVIHKLENKYHHKAVLFSKNKYGTNLLKIRNGHRLLHMRRTDAAVH